MLKTVGFFTVTALAATGALTLVGTAFIGCAGLLCGFLESDLNKDDAKTA